MSKSKKTYELLAESIEGMIEAGDLKGGDRLPPERKLSETYKVSRNTAREAIRILSEKKLLESRIGSGTYVAASALAVLTSSIDEALEHKKNRLKDIFELRKILEPQIAALAAERIKPKTVSILTEIVAKQENAFNSGQESRMFDELFHQTLVEATGNNVLVHVYERLKDILSESRAGNLQSQERQERSLSIHKDILEAIAAGDSNLAARKMKQHMLDVQKTLVLLEKPQHSMKNITETTTKQIIRK